jgi:hypothetical protein
VPCRKRTSALNIEQTEASEAGGELGDAWVCAEGATNAPATASAGSGGTDDARVGLVRDVEDTADDEVRSHADAAVHCTALQFPNFNICLCRRRRSARGTESFGIVLL